MRRREEVACESCQPGKFVIPLWKLFQKVLRFEAETIWDLHVFKKLCFPVVVIKISSKNMPVSTRDFASLWCVWLAGICPAFWDHRPD